MKFKLLNFKFLLIIATVFFGWAGKSLADTHTAASCSFASVQTAYNASSNGDTVSIPTCSETNWGTNTLTIAKANLTIMGQGVGKTILSGDINSGMFFTSNNGIGSNNLRITGIELRNANYGVYINNTRSESIQNLRIDHCKFYNNYAAFENYGHITGVLDNNIFEDEKGAAIRLFGDDNRTATFPFPLGTSDALFLEDSTILINNNFPNHLITSRAGSKYVVRHNTITYNMASGWVATIDAHGMCEGSINEQRGSFTFEVYNNTINGTQGANGKTFQFRGGQGVIFNNNITSYNTNTPYLFLDDYRVSQSDCATKCYQGCCTTYPCTDQINHTYVWNNTFMSGPLNVASADEDFIQLGRDYFTSAMPNYTPYTYPHPLTVGSSPTPMPTPTPTPDTTPPAAPSGLVIN